MYPPPNTRFRFCVRVHVWEPATTKDNSNILLRKGKSDMHTATILHTITTSPNQSTCKFKNNSNELRCVCVSKNQQQQRQFKHSRAHKSDMDTATIHHTWGFVCVCEYACVKTNNNKDNSNCFLARKSDMDTATTLHTKPINWYV